LEDIPYLTNETIFDLEVLPGSMIVLGAGPIGIELSAALNRLGVKVTILQRSAAVLKKDDRELVDRLVQALRAEGVEILTETQTTGLARQADKIVADIEDEKGKRQIKAESVLVSVGRRPNLDGLSLEKAGVDFDSKGIKVDRHLRTTARNIYACGDSIRIYRWEHKDVDRAKTDLAGNGLSKFICNKKGKLLGIHILGHGAGELMHEAQLAKSLGLPFSKIASVIHAYPSYSDAVRQPAKKCYIDILQNKFFIKLLKAIVPKKNKR